MCSGLGSRHPGGLAGICPVYQPSELLWARTDVQSVAQEHREEALTLDQESQLNRVRRSGSWRVSVDVYPEGVRLWLMTLSHRKQVHVCAHASWVWDNILRIRCLKGKIDADLSLNVNICFTLKEGRRVSSLSDLYFLAPGSQAQFLRVWLGWCAQVGITAQKTDWQMFPLCPQYILSLLLHVWSFGPLFVSYSLSSWHLCCILFTSVFNELVWGIFIYYLLTILEIEPGMYASETNALPQNHNLDLCFGIFEMGSRTMLPSCSNFSYTQPLK